MARQYQIPGGPFVNPAQDGREYQLPGYGYFNDETTAAAIVGPLVGGSHLLTNGPLINGRLAA